jgi:hypothetical protein
MEFPEKKGIFLSLRELKTVFPRFKTWEPSLTPGEREVLIRWEKILYASLSVQEAEDLLHPSPEGGGR